MAIMILLEASLNSQHISSLLLKVQTLIYKLFFQQWAVHPRHRNHTNTQWASCGPRTDCVFWAHCGWRMGEVLGTAQSKTILKTLLFAPVLLGSQRGQCPSLPFPGHAIAHALDLATCLHSQPQDLQALHMPQTGQPTQLLVYTGETSHKSDLLLRPLFVPHSTAIS